jgi:HEAT repeat protein
MFYKIPDAVRGIDAIISGLEHQDTEVRREAAAGAQYALLGHLPHPKSSALIDAVGKRLAVIVNGHEALAEPDEYVRERCAYALGIAASAGKDISAHMPALARAREKDPHHWVREAASETLSSAEREAFRMELPLPKAFTTRPEPPADCKARLSASSS